MLKRRTQRVSFSDARSHGKKILCVNSELEMLQGNLHKNTHKCNHYGYPGQTIPSQLCFRAQPYLAVSEYNLLCIMFLPDTRGAGG